MRKLIKRFGWIVNFEAHEFEGIPLLVHFVAGEKCLGKVTSALEVIRDLDPRTYSSLTRLLPGGIAVAERTSVQGWYDSERRACCLGFEFVEAGDVEDIALTIVHELCHARLMKFGIGYEEALRLRVEEVCLRRELAFARLLAQHQVGVRDHVGEVNRRLGNLSEWSYTDQEFRWRARQDALMDLRILKTLPTPKFLRRCAVVRMRRRWQRENERDAESS